MTMASDASDLLEQLDRHLSSPSQAWLFGAGISKSAGVPLMYPLTQRVLALSVGTPHEEVLQALIGQLPSTAHIEHVLSHLADYAAISERAKTNEVLIGDSRLETSALVAAHSAVASWIADTVRWGYEARGSETPERIGKFGESIIDVGEHLAFVEARFGSSQAGLLDRRGPIRLFSTNYDTILEDALALNAVRYWDGFSGGAIAFRNIIFGESDPPAGYRAHIIKLHGSIDWYVNSDGRIRRVRDGDAYPARTGRVLIYPQATKYLATQRDPFAAQFELFRRTFSTATDNVVAVCGYSFGDEHINEEMALAMSAPDNRTTMLVFYYETENWAPCLKEWSQSAWSKRLYVMTQKGLYVGGEGPFYKPPTGEERDWWTFKGVTRLLKDGTGGVR